jgi:hypothetical protein
MGFWQDIINKLRGRSDQTDVLINGVLSKDKQQHMEFLLQRARDFMPNPTNGTYEDEIATRMEYLKGSMQEDMISVLKQRYKETHHDFDFEQLNLNLYQRWILNKAKLFSGQSRLFLVDQDDKEVDDEAQDTFQDIIRKGRILSSFKYADRVNRACHRAGVKAQWDDRRKCATVSVWSPNMVFIVPDPMYWWDADRAIAQLFKTVSDEGVNNTLNSRYEVWALREQEAAQATGETTVHMSTNGFVDTTYRNNDQAVNPFVDPETSKSIYPMVWWQDDAEQSLYTMDDEDALSIPRAMNAHLTDWCLALKYNLFPGAVLEHVAGSSATVPSKITVSAREMLDLPEGTTYKPIPTDFDPNLALGALTTLVSLGCLVQGQNPQTVLKEGAPPESGRALILRDKEMFEDRDDQIEIQRPQIEETGRRVIIVHNTYAQGENGKPIDLKKYRVRWEPGEVQMPIDPGEVSARYQAEIPAGVSTAVDWRMERYGESKEEAAEKVKANLEENRKANEAKMVNIPPVPGQPAAGVDAFTRARMMRQKGKPNGLPKDDQDPEDPKAPFAKKGKAPLDA